MVTSKPSLQVEIAPGLIELLRAMEKPERRAVGELIEKVRKALGHPHEHGGIGLRTLGPGVFECRVDLRRRLVFTAAQGMLTFWFLGHHDDVKRFLRSHH